MENKKYIIHVIKSKREEVNEELDKAKKMMNDYSEMTDASFLEKLTFQLNTINENVKKLEIEIHSMEFVLKELEEN